MDLKELQDLSVLQTKAGPKNAKLYLERIRKNLMTLMCQTDVIELSGDLNAFGGEKDVTANISKAVFGLFCVGNVLGIDVAQGIETRLRYNSEAYFSFKFVLSSRTMVNGEER